MSSEVNAERSNVVLVTGVGSEFGGRLLARLGHNADFERVIGVDTTPPPSRVAHQLGHAEYFRADIRNPLIAKVLSTANVDTVVHASTTAHPAAPGRRTMIKEVNVIGTMRLLAACQRSDKVRKLVVKSTAAVYGAGPRSAAVFTEDSELVPTSSSGYAKDVVEMESYVRGLSRRRPDITVTTARFANLISPDIDTVLGRYFALPVVPTVWGYDARIQLLHLFDALEVLEQATRYDKPGVFNVASDGVLTLSQAIRRAGRVELPMPRMVVPSMAKVLRGAHVVDFSADQLRLLNFGRVIDTSRLKEVFGYVPRWRTVEAFDDYVSGRGIRPIVDGDNLADLVDVAASKIAQKAADR